MRYFLLSALFALGFVSVYGFYKVLFVCPEYCEKKYDAVSTECFTSHITCEKGDWRMVDKVDNW